jgi:hypothetical protein
MVIKLSFSHNNEILNFLISGKEIFYRDRIWAKGVRCIPKDENFIKVIMMSRNKIPSQLINMFNLSEKDKAEYDSCNTEEELAEKIILDCKAQGLILITKEKKQ